jgi:hypothetical protein
MCGHLGALRRLRVLASDNECTPTPRTRQAHAAAGGPLPWKRSETTAEARCCALTSHGRRDFIAGVAHVPRHYITMDDDDGVARLVVLHVEGMMWYVSTGTCAWRRFFRRCLGTRRRRLARAHPLSPRQSVWPPTSLHLQHGKLRQHSAPRAGGCAWRGQRGRQPG